MSNSNVKTRSRISGSSIAIIVLSILLLAAIAIGVVLAYFQATTNAAGTITLGDPVTVNIQQGGSNVTALTFTGDALPGTVYEQAIGIKAPATLSDALMRAKLTIANTDTASTSVQASTTNSWQEGEDDYYYYKGTVSANDSIDFITQITVPTSLTNDDANKTFTVTVVVETIQQANNAANATWTTAPADWLSTYSPTGD